MSFEAKVDWKYDDLVTENDLNRIEQGISNIYDRLDAAESSSVTLQPGLQVINSPKDSRFKLGQIQGKTEINGQGRTGIVGVENPYVVSTSDNLLPPFYGSWATSANASMSIVSDYEIILHTTGTAQGFVHLPSYPVFKNTTYTFSAEHNAGLNIHASGIGTIASNIKDDSVTFNTGDAKVVNIGFVNGSPVGVAGDYTIKNPMLTLGTESKPFKPQRKSMLAFQTDLHANPADGREPDLLFEQNGEYRKLAKWKKVVLDGSLPWENYNQTNGYKVVSVFGGKISGFADSSPDRKFVTKYNGASLPWITESSVEGAFWNDLNHVGGSFFIVPFNSDTGWGDSYTPTTDEIKAYFNGWKMYHVESESYASTYNGVGQKAWVSRANMSDFGGVTVPTTVASNWTPYNLLYRLAKETVEPVTVEGCLTLTEGENVVEVGTGIVLRERANPIAHTNGLDINVNNVNFPASKLSHKVDKIIGIYKNSNFNHVWSIFSGSGAYGNEGVYTDKGSYDQSAAYSVTYLKLEKSPIQPITGTLSANEKAQISDLTAGVAEALQRVSVVEQKKAEKDAPGWITPTLLNGISYNSESLNRSGYLKDSASRVWVTFALVATIPQGTVIFRFAEKYRPRKRVYVTGVTVNEIGQNAQPILISIDPDGSVIMAGVAGTASLPSVLFSGSFLAEQ